MPIVISFDLYYVATFMFGMVVGMLLLIWTERK